MEQEPFVGEIQSCEVVEEEYRKSSDESIASRNCVAAYSIPLGTSLFYLAYWPIRIFSDRHLISV